MGRLGLHTLTPKFCRTRSALIEAQARGETIQGVGIETEDARNRKLDQCIRKLLKEYEEVGMENRDGSRAAEDALAHAPAKDA